MDRQRCNHTSKPYRHQYTKEEYIEKILIDHPTYDSEEEFARTAAKELDGLSLDTLFFIWGLTDTNE